ncbi:MAG: hypothetical protein IAE66_01515 [Xanthomonadaceae bacterium]|nr:hypothetical protein [Xanthomonadaceae bacterium]
MDFLKILRSAEEALYEVMMWLLLYPRTIWLILRHPGQLHAKVSEELTQADDLRFDDVISPPMTLLISVGIGSAMTAGDMENVEGLNALGQFIGNSAYNDWLFSAGISSLLPLIYAARTVLHRGGKIRRDCLRAPFYANAWRISPVALLLPLLIALYALTAWPVLRATCGIAIALLLAWYSWVTAKALMDEGGYRPLRASLVYLTGLFGGLIVTLLIMVALIYPTSTT